MYSVSNAYLAAIKQPIQVHKVRGTIGSVAFTDENILEGSFSISNQSTDTSDIVLGSCYIGQLSATFTGLNISRTEWMNKVITPYFQLWFDAQNYEEVPLGVFTIKEVNHTAEGVEVVAYDNMYKFDKKFKKSGLNMVAKPYNFLIVFCQKCGIELGMNSTQVEALPNGNADLYLCGVRKSTTTYANDIETYRDALFWLAQCLGSFATMRRDGKLVLRAYKDTVDDSISDLYRLSGAKFADYITSYTGIYTESLYDGETTYYGYDLATLQQMRDTAMQELEQIITDLAELEEEYRQGQITEEEYKAQKKVLTSEKKAKEKYISWLDKMIAQAQAEGDGAYMDLGANPFFQRRDANIPSIADATLATTLRSHILSALGKIEYTPFTCSSVFGVHYDLGDVIQFTGGHADDDHGCIMSYEWTLHGQYNMEGYGIDPDKQNVKDVKKKQSERAQKNALAASRNSTSDDVVAPNNGDIKIKMTTINGEVLDIDNMTNSSTPQHPISVNNFTGDNESGYSFSISGYPDSHGYGENVYFTLDGLNNGGKYTVEFDAQFTRADGGWPWSSYYDNVGCNDLRIDLRPDMQERHYSGTFTYNDGNSFWFVFPRVNDNYNFTCAFSNMKFTPAESGVDGMEAYDGENWQNIDYVRTISQTQTSSGGEKIATANNSDGTTTDIYAPKITANPSGASTNLTSLGIAGTDYVIKDANAIPSTEKGANGGVAELDNSGKVPTSQLPSYVDDVVEYASRSAFPATGESGKIYIALDTNLTYRWSGSEYVEISPSLALGETSSTAYRGDRGKTAYDHATESGKISAAVASGLYKIAATAQGHIAGLTAVVKADLTALGVADADNIPTKTSQLTNDSGFITSYTDEKVTCEGVNPSGETAYNLILVPNTGFTANQKPKVNSYFKTYLKKGTANDAGYNYLVLGNDTPTGENANQYGCLRLFGEKYGFANLRFAAASTTERTHYLPDASGTIALTSDIPTKTSDLTNDSGFITSYTDEKVKQQDTTTDSYRRVLLSTNANNDTETGTVRKSGSLTFNPSAKVLKTDFYDGRILNKTVLDLSTLDANTWYPCTASLSSSHANGYVSIRVFVALNSGTKPSWSTHSNGFSCDMHILDTAGGWGTNQAVGFCIAHYYRWCNENPCGYWQMTNSSTAVVFLRGGGNYFVYSDRPMTWTIRTSTYTASSQSVSPVTSYPGINFDNRATIDADISGTAEKASKNASGTAFSPLAVLGLGTGTSKFLREDGTWQTVSVSWSGGEVSSSVYPNTSNSINIGSATKLFANGYIGSLYLGKYEETSGYLVFRKSNYNYQTTIQMPTAPTGTRTLYLPDAGGTLLCNSITGQFYTAAWKATSGASNTKLTDELELPKGKYFAHAQGPGTATANSVMSLSVTSGSVTLPATYCLVLMTTGYAQFTCSFEVTSTTAKVCLTQGSSASATYGYIDRGYLRCIRLS